MNHNSIGARLEKVRQLMKDQNLPALMVTRDDNRRYLSGFTGDSGFLIITPQHAVLSTDSRFWEQAEGQASTFQIHRGKGRQHEMITSALELSGSPKRIGIESNVVTLAQFDVFRSVGA